MVSLLRDRDVGEMPSDQTHIIQHILIGIGVPGGADSRGGITFLIDLVSHMEIILIGGR